MKITRFIALAAVTLLMLACEKEEVFMNDSIDSSMVKSKQANSSSNSYLVIANSNKLPNNLKIDLASANGTLTNEISQIGIAVVSSDDPDFKSKASKIKGIQSVVPNLTTQWLDPNEKNESIEVDAANPPFTGDDDFFFDMQWGHDAVNAPEAWNAGYRGAGVRVAVLDGGFDLGHPDLNENIDFTTSRDFTGEGLQFIPQPGPGGTFSHGTHTAGTIGAADNAFGTIGVAPEVELVLIKVLGDGGSGSFGALINGIIYAALVDTDVINMSLGATFNKSGNPEFGLTARDVAQLKNAIGRAVTFAYQSGTTVIASAGNEATDYDHSADLIHLPSGVQHALSISATAPVGWGADPSTDLDVFASTYSNFGQSMIDFAAPGGNYAYAFEEGGFDPCTVGPLTRVCYVFDYVFSTGSNGNWYWSTGTSMASPHATGVAALIIGKNGGSMHPAQVERELRRSADDLGKPGNDDYYGAGRVNAYRAVTQ